MLACATSVARSYDVEVACASLGAELAPVVKPSVFRRKGAAFRRRATGWTSIGVGVGLAATLGILEVARGPRGDVNSDLFETLHRPASTLLRGVPDDDDHRAAEPHDGHRRLDMYPDDMILTRPYGEDPHRFGLIFFHVVGIGYMLLGLNTVCDIYFTGALETMVMEWNIKPDVAGATFMAAGGSAPELFTSLIGVTIAQNDVGFGTIVGSAVFNVLFVIGLCGYVAKEKITLTWWPLFRDCSYYIFGLSMLAACARDGDIYLHEAIVLFCAYLIYCTIMYFNPALEALTDIEYVRALRQKAKEEEDVKDDTGAPSPEPESVESGLQEPTAQSYGNEKGPNAWAKGPLNQSSGNLSDSSRSLSTGTTKKKSVGGGPKARVSTFLTDAVQKRHEDRMQSLDSTVGTSSTTSMQVFASSTERSDNVDKVVQAEEEEEEESDLLEMPKGTKDRIVWYLSLPIYVPLYYGIPEPTESWFMATFSVSLVWIAGFSFLLVWWVEILGQVFGISTILMSLTVLAAGTSIPDAVSSVAVARQGEGDMAVSSSIGSNIFDILVGLPVPWIIKTSYENANSEEEFFIKIRSKFVPFYVLLLLLMVITVIISVHLHKWRLNKALGMAMLGLYFFFMICVVVVEFKKPEFLMMNGGAHNE